MAFDLLVCACCEVANGANWGVTLEKGQVKRYEEGQDDLGLCSGFRLFWLFSHHTGLSA